MRNDSERETELILKMGEQSWSLEWLLYRGQRFIKFLNEDETETVKDYRQPFFPDRPVFFHIFFAKNLIHRPPSREYFGLRVTRRGIERISFLWVFFFTLSREVICHRTDVSFEVSSLLRGILNSRPESFGVDRLYRGIFVCLYFHTVPKWLGVSRTLSTRPVSTSEWNFHHKSTKLAPSNIFFYDKSWSENDFFFNDQPRIVPDNCGFSFPIWGWSRTEKKHATRTSTRKQIDSNLCYRNNYDG